MFGSTFKGSKWVDYQTFNINKMFIKSGLSYFYYIIILITLTFIFLGRTKSEQYFGFLPFFSYFNFLLGYLPLVFSDIFSQIVIILYAFYTFCYKTAYFFLNKISSNTLTLLSGNSNSAKNELYIHKNSNPNLDLKTMFTTLTFTPNSEKYKIPLISKTLSLVRKDISIINTVPTKNIDALTNYFTPYDLINQTKTNRYINKVISLSNTTCISESESSYSSINTLVNNKVHNTTLTLNALSKFYKTKNYPVIFNFNIKNNLNIANQQR
jgi:hypothetical protein